MVSVKTFIATSAALIAAFVNVEAAVAPTYPSPGTIQVQGQSYDITWSMYNLWIDNGVVTSFSFFLFFL